MEATLSPAVIKNQKTSGTDRLNYSVHEKGSRLLHPERAVTKGLFEGVSAQRKPSPGSYNVALPKQTLLSICLFTTVLGTLID